MLYQKRYNVHAALSCQTLYPVQFPAWFIVFVLINSHIYASDKIWKMYFIKRPDNDDAVSGLYLISLNMLICKQVLSPHKSLLLNWLLKQNSIFTNFFWVTKWITLSWDSFNQDGHNLNGHKSILVHIILLGVNAYLTSIFPFRVHISY